MNSSPPHPRLLDPKTEQFTVFKSTSRNASVRQILGRPGEVWLPESGTDTDPVAK
jgi:streptogramin lyase